MTDVDVTSEKFFADLKSGVTSEYAKSVVQTIEKGDGWQNGFADFEKLINLPEWTGTAVFFILLLIVFESVKSLFKSKGICDAIGYVLHLAMASSIILSVSTLVLEIVGYMQEASAFLGILLPTLGTLLAAGGNIAGAKVQSISLSVALSATQIIINKLVPSVSLMFFGIAIVDSANLSGRMTMLSQTVKKVFYAAFSIFLTLFFIALGTQSLSAAGTDSFSAKALRLFAANAVPIVGSTIGDALRLVGGSLVSVKNTVGSAAVVFLLAMYLPPLAVIFANGVIMNIIIFLCDYFSLGTVKETFIHIKHALGFVLASLTSVFVMGIVNVGVFMGTFPVILT